MEAESHTAEVNQISVLQFTAFFADSFVIDPRAGNGSLIAQEVAASRTAYHARMDRRYGRVINGDSRQRGVPPQRQFSPGEWKGLNVACGVLKRGKVGLCGLRILRGMKTGTLEADPRTARWFILTNRPGLTPLAKVQQCHGKHDTGNQHGKRCQQ